MPTNQGSVPPIPVQWWSFLREFMENGFNASAAALSAGYKHKSRGRELVRRPRFQAMLRQAMRDQGLDPRQIVYGLERMASGLAPTKVTRSETLERTLTTKEFDRFQAHRALARITGLLVERSEVKHSGLVGHIDLSHYTDEQLQRLAHAVDADGILLEGTQDEELLEEPPAEDLALRPPQDDGAQPGPGQA